MALTTLVFATKLEIERLSQRIDQLDKDMEAIAIAIKRNNENTQAILDAISDAKKIPVISIGAVMPKKGDKQLFGTYWSSHGPVRIEIFEYIWDGKDWVMGRSPRAQEICEEIGIPFEGLQ